MYMYSIRKGWEPTCRRLEGQGCTLVEGQVYTDRRAGCEIFIYGV